MSDRMTRAALAVSVLFNVFFLAGYVHVRTGFPGPPPSDEVTERVRDQLGLDEAQTALFADLRRDVQEDAEVYDGGIALVRQELAEEWSSGSRDLDRFAAIIDREADLRRRRQLSAASRMIDFSEALTPPQQRDLARTLSREEKRRLRREQMLERFDANGDGELDRSERAAAREHVRARQAEREQRWRKRSDRP